MSVSRVVQSVGQLIGEVLKQLDEDRFIVKVSSGPRWVVGCRPKVRDSMMFARLASLLAVIDPLSPSFVFVLLLCVNF